MFLNDEERLMVRPKIAVVRDFLVAVNENPFILSRDRAEIVEKMDDLASNVEMAAKKLSEVAGVDTLGFKDKSGEANNYLASGLIAMSLMNEQSIDITLSDTFMTYCQKPYFKLRELEQDEKDGHHHCPEKAKEAMVGLASLHLLVTSVPMVYEQLSRMPAPAPAAL